MFIYIYFFLFFNSFYFTGQDGWPEDDSFGDRYGYERGILMSNEYHVLRRLDTVARLRLGVGCKCNVADIRVSYCSVFFVRKGVLEVVPALRNYDIESQEFDEGYIDMIMAYFWRPPREHDDLPSSFEQLARVRPAFIDKCKTCKEFLSINHVRVPECTWLSIVEFPDSLKQIRPTKLQKVTEISLGGVKFTLGFVLLIENGTHFSSIHYYHDEWFFYDDLGQAKMVKVDLNKFSMDEREYVRAFYYRVAENNPHRCLKRQDMKEVIPVE